ncbi:MAG: enoyl-CoA hydratase family protein [Myxococcales bacterium]
MTSLEPKSFHFRNDEGVGIITFARPELLNALTFEVYRELTDFFRALEHAPEVKCVVITGEGRGFCSGGDVNSIIGELFKRDTVGLNEFTRMTCELVRNMRALHKPIVAALNGVTAGAGAVIALASDLRVASEKAKIAFLFTKVGLAGADMGAAHMLPRVIGLSRATELLMLGDSVDAPTAERYGLFNRVVPHEKLMDEALALARRLAAGPLFALGMTKELLNEEQNQSLFDALNNEARAQAMCMITRDFREAYEAFVEKRPQRFTGR